MTARRILVPRQEVEQLIDLFEQRGLLQAGGAIDVRSDGVTFYPPGLAPHARAESREPVSAFDKWKNSGGQRASQR